MEDDLSFYIEKYIRHYYHIEDCYISWTSVPSNTLFSVAILRFNVEFRTQSEFNKYKLTYPELYLCMFNASSTLGGIMYAN